MLLLSFLSSCTAEELPETEPNLEMENVDTIPPVEGEPPVRTIPPVKIP